MTTKTQNRSSQQAKRNTDTATENVEAAADRIRDLNERILESSKKAGNVYLDTYEKTLHSIADFQEKVGKESQTDWIEAMTKAQSRFTRELTDAYTSSARQLLK